MNYADILRADLVLDEGDRSKPYVDTRGKITIGIGHNLTDNGISQAVKDAIYAEDVSIAEAAAFNLFPAMYSFSDARKAALVNLAFNMGASTFSTFHTFIGLVNAGDWNGAADDLLGTAYAKQVGARAQRRADQLRNG